MLRASVTSAVTAIMEERRGNESNRVGLGCHSVLDLHALWAKLKSGTTPPTEAVIEALEHLFGSAAIREVTGYVRAAAHGDGSGRDEPPVHPSPLAACPRAAGGSDTPDAVGGPPAAPRHVATKRPASSSPPLGACAASGAKSRRKGFSPEHKASRAPAPGGLAERPAGARKTRAWGAPYIIGNGVGRAKNISALPKTISEFDLIF